MEPDNKAFWQRFAKLYGPESFDAVVIANALHIMPDPDKALAEIRRVLGSNTGKST